MSLASADSPATRPGPLEQRVLDIYRLGVALDPCELKADAETIRLNLARALDAREQEFTDYNRLAARSTHLSFSTSGLQVGPLSLISRADAPKPSDEKKLKTSGWVSFTSGWDDYDKEYQAIRNQRVNARWVRLLGLVRATIADDYNRAVTGTWMGVSAEGVTKSPDLVKSIDGCLKDKKCDDLQKPDAFKEALTLTPYAAQDYDAYTKATTDDAKARALRNFRGDVQSFVTYFEPVKQRGTRLSDDHQITVSLDSGNFRGSETEMGRIIEKFWKVGENSVKIEWMTSTRDEPIFTLFFAPIPKSGSGIDYIRRAITLGQSAVESVPAHEIGRAMGFRARYFSVWHADTCKYEDESKPDDLLSDGRRGSITNAHWDSLKKAYSKP